MNSLKDYKSLFAFLFITIPILVVILIVFYIFNLKEKAIGYTGPRYLSKETTWGLKSFENDEYHGPLNVYNIKETESELKFEVPCHMTLKNETTRKCTFYYTLNKDTAVGKFHAKVTGVIDRGVRVASGKIYLTEISPERLKFRSVAEPQLTWHRLRESRIDKEGFIVFSD